MSLRRSHRAILRVNGLSRWFIGWEGTTNAIEEEEERGKKRFSGNRDEEAGVKKSGKGGWSLVVLETSFRRHKNRRN